MVLSTVRALEALLQGSLLVYKERFLKRERFAE
jgi:hypothetical protein